MKIRPVGAELFHADGRTDRRDEAHSRLFAIFSKAAKKKRKLSRTSFFTSTQSVQQSIDFALHKFANFQVFLLSLSR